MQSNRKQWIRYAVASLLGMALLPSAPAAKNSSKDGTYFVYVGTYTRGDSKGVYAYRFDSKSGNLEKVGLAGEVVNPSWVTVHPNGKFLYAVSELGNDGKSSGMVTAFAIDPKTAMLTKLNSVSSGGGGACHLYRQCGRNRNSSGRSFGGETGTCATQWVERKRVAPARAACTRGSTLRG
jgi:6-phosphogluconolactonase